MRIGALRVVAMSPEGSIMSFDGPGLWVEQATSDKQHWTLHRDHEGTYDALVGIIPKTWILRIDLP